MVACRKTFAGNRVATNAAIGRSCHRHDYRVDGRRDRTVDGSDTNRAGNLGS